MTWRVVLSDASVTKLHCLCECGSLTLASCPTIARNSVGAVTESSRQGTNGRLRRKGFTKNRCPHAIGRKYRTPVSKSHN
jgi:hypothetical protein